MNFNQWRNYAAKGEVAKITYICGEQNTLSELVLDDIKNILKVSVTDYTSLDGSQSSDVWDIASQYPLDPDGYRLTVVRNSERVTNWDELATWLSHSRNNPKNFLVFVSSQSDAPAIFSGGKRSSYADHIELIRSKGKFVKCSQPSEEDLVKWCQSYGLTSEASQFLVDRTAGNVPDLLSVLKKVKVWPGSPNKNALALLCQEQAVDSVADHLILQEKKSAILALHGLSTDDYAKVISRLDKRLDIMIDINRCVARRMYAGDIAQTTGINVFLVNKFKGVASNYDFNKVKQCRQLVTLADAHLRAGATVGILEMIIGLW